MRSSWTRTPTMSRFYAAAQANSKFRWLRAPDLNPTVGGQATQRNQKRSGAVAPWDHSLGRT